MLHLRTARCDRSAAASAAPSTTPSWTARAREAPSAPDRTPPLAIYVRRFALFLFRRWFSIRSLLFSLASRTALDIAGCIVRIGGASEALKLALLVGLGS